MVNGQWSRPRHLALHFARETTGDGYFVRVGCRRNLKFQYLSRPKTF